MMEVEGKRTPEYRRGAWSCRPDKFGPELSLRSVPIRTFWVRADTEVGPGSGHLGPIQGGRRLGPGGPGKNSEIGIPSGQQVVGAFRRC